MNNNFAFNVLKNDNNYCWYPSGGTNFVAIKSLSKNIGNKIHPKHFVFTDYIYCVENIKSYLSTISDAFHVEQSQILNYIQATEINTSINIESSEYIDTFERRKKWISKGEEDGDVAELIEFGIIDEDSYRLWKGDTLDDKACLFHFNFSDITIWLLNCSNEDFYNYCLERDIKLDAIMLYRHNDNFLYQNEELVIKKLEIKEGIGSSNYMQFNKEKLIETGLIWDSNYNAQQRDIVSIIQYC